MSGRPEPHLAGFPTLGPLHKLARKCRRSRQRKIIWLGCFSVAAIIVVYLPLIFHTPVEPAAEAGRTRTQTIEQLHPTRIALTDSNLLSKFAMDKIFASLQLPEMSKEAHFEEDSYLESLCKSRMGEGLEYQTVSLILSLRNVSTEAEAINYLRQHFQMIPFSLTDDVIITADTHFSKTFKDTIEEFVDLCPVCRLLFLPGTIYKHWNFAAKFARSKYLVFLDARILLTNNSLQTMIKCLHGGDKKTVVSPQLRLRYSDGSGHSVGLSRNEITWDLGVSRAAVSYQLLETAQRFGDCCVNQTAIFKEVFGIRKQFFTDLGGFDLLPDVSGGEHVSFSLKVLSCHGNIVTSLCSKAYLTIANKAGRPDDRKSPMSSVLEDYRNPTFDTNRTSISAYYIAGSKPWLDSFSAKYYTCSLGRRIPSSTSIQTRLPKKPSRSIQEVSSTRMTFDLNRYFNSRYGYFGYNLKQSLVKSKCKVGNFRYIITQRQPHMLPPTKFATFYGYIKTLDGMYAVGRPTETPASDTKLPERGGPIPKQTALIPEQDKFILTRNTSLWIGPFSFTNGAFIYSNIWCLTVSTSVSLTLQKCLKGEANQLFTFSNNTITLLGLPTNCVGAKMSLDVSSDILMSPCSDQNRLTHFKLDVKFDKKCIK